MVSSCWSVLHLLQHLVSLYDSISEVTKFANDAFFPRGVVNMYGVYQTYYQTSLLRLQSAANLSWIGSIQAFLLLFVGALTGVIYDAGYLRSLLWVGAGLSVFGMMMTSISTHYWHFVLAQGIMTGCGFGSLFVPSIAIVSQYFSTRKTFATGIASTGSSLGQSQDFDTYTIMVDILNLRRNYLSHHFRSIGVSRRIRLGNSCGSFHHVRYIGYFPFRYATETSAVDAP